MRIIIFRANSFTKWSNADSLTIISESKLEFIALLIVSSIFAPVSSEEFSAGGFDEFNEFV